IEPGDIRHTITGSADSVPPVTDRIGRFILDPHAAIRAARLSAALCVQHGLCAALTPRGYLTGDVLPRDPLLAAFEGLEVLPFDRRRVRAALRQRHIGNLEV